MQRFILAGALICAMSLGHGALAQDADRVAKGEAIYANYCSDCHGEELRNTSGGVTFDLRLLKPNEHGRFVTSVNNGKNQMPPWRGVVSDDEIESLWAYIMAKGG